MRYRRGQGTVRVPCHTLPLLKEARSRQRRIERGSSEDSNAGSIDGYEAGIERRFEASKFVRSYDTRVSSEENTSIARYEYAAKFEYAVNSSTQRLRVCGECDCDSEIRVRRRIASVAAKTSTRRIESSAERRVNAAATASTRATAVAATAAATANSRATAAVTRGDASRAQRVQWRCLRECAAD